MLMCTLTNSIVLITFRVESDVQLIIIVIIPYVV